MWIGRINEIIDTINGFTTTELFTHELILSSRYYNLSVVCLDIKSINVKHDIDDVNIIELVMNNGRVYQFQYVDVDLVMDIIEREDVKIVEDKHKRRHRRK